ncbi:hypothetical protein J7L87_03930, partial [bacterium]|nr:hypothetical protein [bacterium]
MKRWVLFIYFIPFFCSSHTILNFKKLDFDKDGKEEILLENDYIKLFVCPRTGGIIKSFRYRDVEFTGRGGILEDHLWDQKFAGDFYQKPYFYEIKKEKEKITVHLWRKGEEKKFLEIHKYVSLFSDKASVFVEYVFKNLPQSRMSMKIKPWFHHFICLKGKNYFFIPTTEGIRKIEHDPENPKKDMWFFNPARGWTGVIGENSFGLVFLPDYKYIKCFYNWFSREGATIEWRFFPVEIGCGKEFKTAFSIIPFYGLKYIHGAGKDVVGCVEKEDNEIRIDLFTGESKKIDYVVKIFDDYKKEKGRIVKKGSLNLFQNRVNSFKIPLTEKISIVRCEGYINKNSIFDLERVFQGEGVRYYVLKPKKERMKSEEEVIDINYK